MKFAQLTVIILRTTEMKSLGMRFCHRQEVYTRSFNKKKSNLNKISSLRSKKKINHIMADKSANRPSDKGKEGIKTLSKTLVLKNKQTNNTTFMH